MPPTTAIDLLRATLGVVEAEWVLWALDSDGVFRVHEGPGVLRAGLRPGELLGASVWERYARDEAVLAFVRAAYGGPRKARLVVNGHSFVVTGAPDAVGGVAGLALALGDGASRADTRRVIELTRAIPQLGAQAGDLLVPDPGRHDRAWVVRSVELDAVPDRVQLELRALSRDSAEGSSSRAAADSDVGRARRATAAHLRLLP